jgi:protein O-GlcNAcase/histone acetyltransferase
MDKHVRIDCLLSLITAAAENGITFIYALSPGIDVHYAQSADWRALDAKFDQVRALGCTAFALLFDDIEVRMNDNDRKKFGSFAAAQV